MVGEGGVLQNCHACARYTSSAIVQDTCQHLSISIGARVYAIAVTVCAKLVHQLAEIVRRVNLFIKWFEHIQNLAIRIRA